MKIKQSLELVDFETAIDTLCYGAEELQLSKNPILLPKLTEVILRLSKLDEKVERLKGNEKYYAPQIQLAPLKSKYDIPDFQYVHTQIEAAWIDIGYAIEGVSLEWFTTEINSIIEEIRRLLLLFEWAEKIVNKHDTPAFANIKSVIEDVFPVFIPLIKMLKNPSVQKTIHKSYDKKDLPRPRNGGYKKSRIHFTSIETGSKNVPGIFKGSGKTADRSLINDLHKLSKI
ncbi:hypothetical protein [Falsibacillus pallidus]|uniref:Uncharacterized protein n=1 Tax=Falsibacillus pallidus TaxID=493781 RepID=A0A370GD63_9BACI|nr:hypothetical protein [Falsibacillus pallidus]RDI41637.1 hypothetical protein DFR59_10791 [Falsibacillus pallidus]